MEAIECMLTRRSVRKFTDQPIDHELIRKIIETTSYAPSWKNTQVVRYTCVEDREKLEKIANEANGGYIYNTKTMQRSKVLVIQTVIKGISGYEEDGTYSTDKKDGWQMYDAGISAQTFCLAAHNYGIGTVIMGLFDDVKIRNILGIPDSETVTAVIGMGYPLSEGQAPKRKNVDELVRFI